MSRAWSSYHSPKASDARTQTSNAGKKGMAGSARGSGRPPACHQNLVSLTLSTVTLPVAKIPGKRMMIMHITQMHQQLLTGCKEAFARSKLQATNLMILLVLHKYIGAWVHVQPHLCVTQLDSVILLASSLHCSFKTSNLILQVVCLAQFCLVTTKYLNGIHT